MGSGCHQTLLPHEDGSCVQPPYAENRTYGGVGGCRGAIPGTRPDLSFVPPGQGLSGFCHLRHSEPAQALDFIPAVQAAAQETEHPQVTAATELTNPPALGQDVAAEPPAVRYSAPVSALHKAPPPHHYEAGERFENEQPHLQRD